jgi:hypothetical protein
MNVAAPKPTPEDHTGKVGGLIDRSPVKRAQTIMKSYDDLELRNIDIPMHHLSTKYEKEFQVAEENIANRKNSWAEAMRLYLFYDYGNDKRYDFWLDEKRQAKDALHEHWIDNELDNPELLVKHGIRVFGGVGIAHGLLRTRYLWKTMDRNYVKMHGVGLASIGTYEVPIGCLKGIGLALAFALGCMSGDMGGRVVQCVYEGTVVRPRRNWENIAAAGLCSGLLCGCSLSYMVNGLVGPTVQKLAGFGLWSAMTGIGTCLGVFVYAPWVKLHPESYDDPHHKPWQDRKMRFDGPTATRGRYS